MRNPVGVEDSLEGELVQQKCQGQLQECIQQGEVVVDGVELQRRVLEEEGRQ